VSYDLNLFRKDGSKEPFEREDIEGKLHNSFKYVALHPESGPVLDFEVSRENEADSYEFHYHGKENGCYWTYCSYGVDEETFREFKSFVKEVAIALGMRIQDVQHGINLINPEEFITDDVESTVKFRYVKKVMKKVAEHLR